MLKRTLHYKGNKHSVTYDITKVFDSGMIETVDGTDVCELEEDFVNDLELILLDKLNESFPDETSLLELID